MTDLQILEKRLKRAEKSFEEGLQQYNLHLSNNARSKEENESDLDKLRVLIKRLQSAYPPVIEEYEKVTGSNTVDQKIEEVEKRQRDTEFQFVDATHALKRKFPPQQPAAPVNNIVVQAPAAVQQPAIVQQSGGRLQEIKMPDFHGDRAQYPKFKSMFEMNIHARGDLSDACKLSYFVSFLKGEAANRVGGYEISPQNYQVVKDLIDKEYGKTELIIDAHLKKLFRLMGSSPAPSDFQMLYIEASTHARALKALNHNEENIKSTMLTLLPDKMPGEMKRLWFRETNGKDPATITLQSLYDFIELELAVNSRFKASSNQPQQHRPEPHQSHGYRHPKTATLAALHVSSKHHSEALPPCLFCGSTAHKSGLCYKTIEARKKVFSNEMLCFKCARKGHAAASCKKSCAHCLEGHHIYICQKMSDAAAAKAPTTASSWGGKKKKADTHKTVCSRPLASNLVLQTFSVLVAGPKGSRKCRVLLDGGAHRSYITQRLAASLGLVSKRTERQNISVFGGDVEERTMVKSDVKFKTKTNSISISVLQLPTICDPVPAITLGDWKQQLDDQNFNMADDVEQEEGGRWNGQIDILIGVQDYYSIVTGRSFSLSTRLKAVETVFGWVVHGKLDHVDSSHGQQTVLIASSAEEEKIDKMLQQLFDQDAVHPLDPVGGEDDDPALSHFRKTMKQLSDGQYQLRLPFKENRPHLPSNFRLAEKQARAHLKKWKTNDPAFLAEYNNIICGYIAEGQVEEVPSELVNKSEGCHYLLNRPVLQPHKNTKIRPVFNASLGKPSLNDCLHTGKNRVPLMTSILTRLRVHRFVVTGDYRKAFLHISIAEEDRDFMRFLWWEDPLGDNPKLRFLRFMCAVFGNTCSPGQLENVLTHHVTKYIDKYPRTARIMLNNTFVDDVVGGGERVEEAEQFVREAVEIAAAAKMKLQRWQSNDANLQHKLDQMETGSKESSQEEKAGDIFSLFESPLKVLGSVWDRKRDVFTFDTSALEEFCESLKHRTCLRTVLKICARVYDTLGLISPVTILGRIFMQGIHRKKLSWDQELPADMKKEFWTWADDLRHVTAVAVPRHLFNNKQRPRQAQLHVCCDASLKARGAVAYCRTEVDAGKVNMTLLGSKTRVAPLQDHSVARLELLAAELAVKLAQSIIKSLEGEIEFEVFFWTDSMVVLYWVSGEWYMWKTWVRNRAKTIQEAFPRSAWRHIPGKENPADLCSRGVLASKLVEPDCIWWSGPKFLYKPQDQWTSATFDNRVMQRPDVQSEAKPPTTIALISLRKPSSPPFFNVKRFGTWETVLRMTARIQRKLANATRARKNKPEHVGELSATELNLAKFYWYRQLQAAAFPDELKALRQNKPVHRTSNIVIFRPYLDSKDGLIKMDARTKLSADHLVTPDVPILPCKLPGIKEIPHVIKLIIRYAHRRVCHLGQASTLGEVRRECWIIRGRQTVIQVLCNCVTCNKQQKKAYQQPTALLPESRCTFSPPFSVSGLDIAGPLIVKGHRVMKKKNKSPASKEAGSKKKRGRPAKEIVPKKSVTVQPNSEPEPEEFKVWVLMFTCSTTRALHQEVMMKIDTSETIMAIDRFVARRGVPSIIYSDNGTQLKKANKEITGLWNNAIQGVQQYAAREGIEWRFIVEKAPWWGGFYERMIGTLKPLLWKNIGKARLTVKELETALCKIEAAINNRPITYQFSSPGEPRPLTPSDLLIVGQRATLLPPRFPDESLPVDSVRLELVERAKYRDLVVQEWQHRWQKEYLAELAKRFNTIHKTQPIKIGEVVLIEVENRRRKDWIPAVIKEVFVSADGVVRSVELRTPTGTLRRPVQLLHAFELNENRPLSDIDYDSDEGSLSSCQDSTLKTPSAGCPRQPAATLESSGPSTNQQESVVPGRILNATQDLVHVDPIEESVSKPAVSCENRGQRSNSPASLGSTPIEAQVDSASSIRVPRVRNSRQGSVESRPRRGSRERRKRKIVDV